LVASLLILGYDAIITFCVSRRQRKMYCGHVRLCVRWDMVEAAP